MGSQLDPALANIFRYSFQSNFSSPDHADEFEEYFSSKHHNINVSIEKKKDGCIPFLYVKIFREKRILQLTSTEKIPLVEFIPTSKVVCLK